MEFRKQNKANKNRKYFFFHYSGSISSNLEVHTCKNGNQLIVFNYIVPSQ